MRIFLRPSKEPFRDPAKIFAKILKNLIRSYKDPSQDLCMICSTILQDPQGIEKDLPNIFKRFIS